MGEILTEILAALAGRITQTSPRWIPWVRDFLKVAKIEHPNFDSYKDYDIRLYENSLAKARIAYRVTTEVLPELRVNSKESILLDSGSVTYNIAFQLFVLNYLRIVTNNLAVQDFFRYQKNQPPDRCKMLGGEVMEEIRAVVGEDTIASAIKELRGENKTSKGTNIAVLGLRAYSKDKGIAEDTPRLSEFQASMMRHAKQLIVVAQGEKFLKKANAPILESREFRKLIDKRNNDKSLWFIHHLPATKLNEQQSEEYNNNLNSFLSLLPNDRILDSSETKVPENLVIRKEIQKA